MEASALSHPVGLGRLSVTGPLLRLRSDDQLVALFRAGHDEAFGVIHDRYRQRLVAYAGQMLGGSRSDAEDVLQDVFLRAYNALRVDARPLSLRAWLYRVAHNRCIDQLRRPTPSPEDIYDLNRVPQQDPLAAAERREDLRRLVCDVGRLPDQQRSALLMREMEGLSYNDLAEALGVTIPAVKSLLVRARIGLVEAVEARDTACRDIRLDLASAFDRGVRVSGRSRRHLRECTGCCEYRTALRGLEHRLGALSPGVGPLAALAKILGIGSAGSGAAAGGSAAAGGGGAVVAGAAAGGGAATVGSGIAAVTAGKVAAVVAAAAVVGGGAATVEHRVEHHPRPAAISAPAPATHRATAAPMVVATGRTPARAVHGAAPATATITVTDRATGGARPAGADPVDVTAAPTTPATPYEPTTGGLQAPEDTAAPTTAGTAADPATGTTGSAGAPSAAGNGSVPATADATGSTGATGASTAPGQGSPSTAGTTSGTAASGGTPIAQGAAVATP